MVLDLGLGLYFLIVYHSIKNPVVAMLFYHYLSAYFLHYPYWLDFSLLVPSPALSRLLDKALEDRRLVTITANAVVASMLFWMKHGYHQVPLITKYQIRLTQLHQVKPWRSQLKPRACGLCRDRASIKTIDSIAYISNVLPIVK